MEEPLEQYIANFDEYQGVIEELLESTLDLSDIDSRLVDVLTAPKLLEAFRYLAGPPISDDDLKVVAEAVLSRQRIMRDPEIVGGIKQVVLSGLDRRRFPWVIEGREPTESQQEAAVHSSPREMGFTQVASRKVSVLSNAPAPGEFCAESDLGGRKADVLVGLWDRRVMPIECKVSNSSTNSIKRLNNDAAVKAETWRKDFGQLQMVPSAVLGGVDLPP